MDLRETEGKGREERGLRAGLAGWLVSMGKEGASEWKSRERLGWLMTAHYLLVRLVG